KRLEGLVTCALEWSYDKRPSFIIKERLERDGIVGATSVHGIPLVLHRRIQRKNGRPRRFAGEIAQQESPLAKQSVGSFVDYPRVTDRTARGQSKQVVSLHFARSAAERRDERERERERGGERGREIVAVGHRAPFRS
ncbi:hypothetical protein ALC56_14385, partial [Trachymyrmex septentrionalis]